MEGITIKEEIDADVYDGDPEGNNSELIPECEIKTLKEENFDWNSDCSTDYETEEKKFQFEGSSSGKKVHRGASNSASLKTQNEPIPECEIKTLNEEDFDSNSDYSTDYETDVDKLRVKGSASGKKIPSEEDTSNSSSLKAQNAGSSTVLKKRKNKDASSTAGPSKKCRVESAISNSSSGRVQSSRLMIASTLFLLCYWLRRRHRRIR